MNENEYQSSLELPKTSEDHAKDLASENAALSRDNVILERELARKDQKTASVFLRLPDRMLSNLKKAGEECGYDNPRKFIFELLVRLQGNELPLLFNAALSPDFMRSLGEFIKTQAESDHSDK